MQEIKQEWIQMAETLKLDLVERESQILSASNALREGKLIIAPLEHGYVFVADAFNHGAVKKMHNQHLAQERVDLFDLVAFRSW